DFGAPNGPLPQGVFVVALDAASGSVAWSFGCEMSTALHASASSIALGPSGSVTIGGVYKGSLACGGTAMTSASSASYSAFVARVDSNGAPVWATSWGDSSTTTPVDQELFGLAVDSDGSTWLSGGLRGHAIVAGHALTAAGTTDSDVLLARLKPDGSFAAYAKNFGDAATQQGSALSLDQDGNVYLTGFKEGSLDFGNGALPQLGGDTIFVAAFDATGAPLWSEGFGGAAANNEYGNAIAVEPDGTLFVASTFVGGVNFGAGAFISGAANYTALARFAAGAPDQPGGVIWNRFYGGDKSNTHASATVAAAALAPRGQSMVRDVLLVGRFAEPADFGTGMVGPMQALPNASAFVMRVAP
ncbi:MAG TPA: hypothetical protein VHB21_23720, partial [Minicystis sp.]|nr:hypothetical protein [Minicystis sp.]